MSKLIILSACLLGSVSIANAYNPADLDKFNNSNICNQCDLSNAYLNGNHSQASLINTNLSGVSAGYINLSQAVLSGANMTNSNFINANLSAANLTDAVLIMATLDGANLYGAKITSEQLSQAKSICNAILPDGSIGKCP